MIYKQHPLSAAFPSMPDEDFAALVADIEANGQRDPAVLFEGMVIDGWHRTRACDQLAMPLLTVDLQPGLDPVAFVQSRNLHRRHLTASQRAIAVAACAKWLPHGGHIPGSAAERGDEGAIIAPSSDAPDAAGKSLAELAGDAGVSRRTMAQAAKVVKEAAPEVVRAVKDGALPVARAAEIAAMPKGEQAEAAKQPAPAASKPRAKPADDGSAQRLQAQLDATNEALTELTQNLQTAVDENNAMAAVLEADDKLAEALAQNKKLRAEVSGLRERVNGLMGERNEAVRMVKHWKGRAERAEKAGATA